MSDYNFDGCSWSFFALVFYNDLHPVAWIEVSRLCNLGFIPTRLDAASLLTCFHASIYFYLRFSYKASSILCMKKPLFVSCHDAFDKEFVTIEWFGSITVYFSRAIFPVGFEVGKEVIKAFGSSQLPRSSPWLCFLHPATSHWGDIWSLSPINMIRSDHFHTRKLISLIKSLAKNKTFPSFFS